MANETENTSSSEQTTGEQATKACRTAEEMAAETVRIAKLELEKAQKIYEDLRQQATAKVREVREKNVGELVDSTLDAIKKYPGRSMVVSIALGVCVGRWVQRFLGR
jgi:ElaB/YqjD/DUF883 family membrane-anchored ribosome-binding protein